MLIHSASHLWAVLWPYAGHYNEQRPPSSATSGQLIMKNPVVVPVDAPVQRREIFGGVINEYRRPA